MNESTRTFAQVTSFPFGEPFQRGLLALAFREPKFVERYGFTLAPAYFDIDEYRHLARVILDYASKHFRCPDREIARELVIAYCINNRFELLVRDRLITALEAIVGADLSHDDWVREKAVEFAVAQAMRDEVLRAAKILTEGRYEDYSSVIVGMQKALDMGVPNEQVLVFRDVAASLPEYLARESSLTQVRRITTGIRPLDDDMFGGPGRGHLGVILGPSKKGKSHVLVSLGSAAMAAGFGVHHITIQDLDVWDVALRYASNISGIPSQDIQQGTPNYVSTISRFMESFRYDLAITEFPADTLTPAALRSHISTTIAKTGVNPDIIIVDYADLMTSGHKPTFNSAEKSEQMGWLYLQLLKIFHQFDAVGWTCSQVQREQWDRELIGNSGVARSVQKINHAHYILTINQTDIEAEENKIRLYSSGFRRGRDKQTYHCILDKSTSRLSLDPTPRVDQRRNAHEEAINAPIPLGQEQEDLLALVARLGGPQ